MKQWYIKRVQERLERHFTRNFARIPEEEFVCGEMRYNYQCHRVAVHHCFLQPENKMFLVYALDNRDQSTCLHVINRLPSGHYQDNTWGSEFRFHSYYFIKEILPDQYHRVPELFDNHRRDYIKLYARYWLIRLLRIQPTDVF
ncbi:hypothetical protein [Spirosoma sp.]|uniref:hypothetical protein n=1 Tax=Spirosoma sp. TaxID=1899569 RepID=UPI0026121846|nr:hypothetical protein [Spirosoma sp.]MCX6218360.1 hypothetical protein [Spirosoma sp.]